MIFTARTFMARTCLPGVYYWTCKASCPNSFGEGGLCGWNRRPKQKGIINTNDSTLAMDQNGSADMLLCQRQLWHMYSLS